MVGAQHQQTNTALVLSAAVFGLLYAVVRTVLQWSFFDVLHGFALPLITISSIIVFIRQLRPRFGSLLPGIFGLLLVTWFLLFSADFIWVRHLVYRVSFLVVWSFGVLLVGAAAKGVPTLADSLKIRALATTDSGYYGLGVFIIGGAIIYAYSMAIGIPLQDWIAAKYDLVEYPSSLVFSHSVTNPGASSLLLLARGVSYFLIWLIWVWLLWSFLEKLQERLESLKAFIPRKRDSNVILDFVAHLLSPDPEDLPDLFLKLPDSASILILLWFAYIGVCLIVMMSLICCFIALFTVAPFLVFSPQLEWVASVTRPF